MAQPPIEEKETLVDPREKAYLDKQIKKAYKDNDADASRKLHHTKIGSIKSTNDHINNDKDYTSLIKSTPLTENEKIKHQLAEKKHKGKAGEFIKSIIFGGLDGIITLFAIVASISGSDIAMESVIVLGFAKLVGDGISMGIGDFLSEKAEIDFTKSELEREKWEFDNYKEGEIKEMIEIYEKEGVSTEDAQLILNTMANYPDFFINHMMRMELELNARCIDDSPIKHGGVTLASFLVFGTIPMLSYLIFNGIDVLEGGTDWKLIITIILTCLTLFGMGAVKGYYCNNNIFISGLLVTLNGTFAASAAYFISWGLNEAMGVD